MLSKESVVVDDPPKLESWSVVCRQLYTLTERTRLVGIPGESALGIHLIFLNKLITGELFQTPQDWQDLQRRLRAHGYSDDLTGLKQTMLIPPGRQNHPGDAAAAPTGSTEPTTTTTGAAAASPRVPGTSMAGQKRSVMDCHGDNENQQYKPADDRKGWRKKLKCSLHERLRARANCFANDSANSSRPRLLSNLQSAIHRLHAHNYSHPVPLYRNDAPAGTAVVIPQDPGEANTIAESMATAPDTGWSQYRKRQLESAVQAALREYQATFQDSSLGKASATSRKDVPPAVHNNREETVPANVVATNLVGLAACATLHTNVALPLPDNHKIAPVASLPQVSNPPCSMDLTMPGNDVIPSNVYKTQGMVVSDTTATPTSTSTTTNNITQDYSNDKVSLDTPKKSVTTDHDSTSSPTDEQKVPVLTHPMDPMDVADTVMAVPTESNETPVVLEDCSLNSQDQKEEEAESSSMIISADANTTTTNAVVVPDVLNPRQGGLFRNTMITMVVWSISLHFFLWTLLETTDHRLWRMMNEPYNIPLRVCLSMEAIRQPRVHSLATVADWNPNQGPWLGQEQGQDTSSPRTMMMGVPNSSSSIHLHRLCSPWYGLMSLTFGVLFSMWILAKLLKQKKTMMLMD